MRVADHCRPAYPSCDDPPAHCHDRRRRLDKGADLLGHDVGPFQLFGQDVGPFRLAADIKRVGFCSVQHEARADLTMFLGLLLFLLIVGAGRWSLDALAARAGKLRISGTGL